MLSKKNKQYVLQIKSIDEQNMIIDMVGSTSDVDRVGDIVVIDGVDYSDYMKNPIVLPNHNYSSQAIGKTLSITPGGNKLIFKIQFASTEMGKEWFYLYSKGFMSSSSIGFIPIEYKPNDSGGYTYTKIQLLEISLVTVPCQQNANIIRAFEGGHISKALFDLINKNKKGGNKKMEKEKLEKMVNDLVSKKIKSVLEKKDTEIKALKKKLAGAKVKAGATLSQGTVDALVAIAEKIHSAAESLEEFVEDATGREIPDDDPETGDDTVTCSQCGTINPVENSYCSKCGTQLESENDNTEKEYTDEEISKMIEDNVQKTIDAYSSK